MRQRFISFWHEKVAPTIVGLAFASAILCTGISAWNSMIVRHDVNNHTAEISAVLRLEKRQSALSAQLKRAGTDVRKEAVLIQELLIANGVTENQIKTIVTAFCQKYIPRACPTS